MHFRRNINRVSDIYKFMTILNLDDTVKNAQNNIVYKNEEMEKQCVRE